MKHGILLTDDFFGFCADKVITEDGRYSILEYMNNDENYRKCRFQQFNPPEVLEWVRDQAMALEKEEAKRMLDEYTDLYYWLTRGDIADSRFNAALQRAWMILKEMSKCEKCKGDA